LKAKLKMFDFTRTLYINKRIISKLVGVKQGENVFF
jgi:hypothetical protein